MIGLVNTAIVPPCSFSLSGQGSTVGGESSGNRALIFVQFRIADQSPSESPIYVHPQSYLASLGADSIQRHLLLFPVVVGLEHGYRIRCRVIDHDGYGRQIGSGKISL